MLAQEASQLESSLANCLTVGESLQIQLDSPWVIKIIIQIARGLSLFYPVKPLLLSSEVGSGPRIDIANSFSHQSHSLPAYLN